MTLRFRYRHVHATLFDFVRGHLVTLGWGDASKPANDPVNAVINFNASPMTFIDFQPDEAGIPVAPQTVALTLGDDPPSEDQELGAGLTQVRYSVFIDIYGANQAITQAVASDVKDMLEEAYFPVLDYTQVPPLATDEQVELWHEDVAVNRPQVSIGAQDFKRYWRIVTTTARVDYLV